MMIRWVDFNITNLGNKVDACLFTFSRFKRFTGATEAKFAFL